MNRFAELLDRLAYEPARNNKLRLMTEYFGSVADPERGFALAALTGALSFQHAKPGIIRALIAERTDPVLFELSYDYVGDLSETVALMWPAQRATDVIKPEFPPHERSAPSPACGGGVGIGQACTSLRGSPLPNPPPQAGEGTQVAPIPSLQELPPRANDAPSLSTVVKTLSTLGKSALPAQL